MFPDEVSRAQRVPGFCLLFIMKITELQFYLLVFCGAVESLTEKSVDLGANVTLQCEVDVKHVFWVLMKPSEPPVWILRSFSSRSPRGQYSNSTFNKTFSLQLNSSLFIHNISTDELGVYYCIGSQTPSTVSRGIRLSTRNHSAAPGNQTRKQDISERKCEVCSLWQSLFTIAAVITCLLITGFMVHHCIQSRKSRAQPPDPGVALRQDNTNHLYAEVRDTVTNRDIRITNLHSTYSLLQPASP